MDEVKRSLGYRFQLDAIAHPTSAARGQAASFEVALRNVGWSRIFSPRRLIVMLRNRTTGAILSGSGVTDLRTVPDQASASTALTVTVAIPAGADLGTYDVAVGLPDVLPTTASDPRQAIRFANPDDPGQGQAWDASRGLFS